MRMASLAAVVRRSARCGYVETGCNARDELPPLWSITFVIGENGTTFQPYASCHCVTVIACVGIGQCEDEGRLETFEKRSAIATSGRVLGGVGRMLRFRR